MSDTNIKMSFSSHRTLYSFKEGRGARARRQS